LTEGPVRITVYDMKNDGVVTVRLDRDLKRQLDRICKESDRTRSDVVRDALRRQIALMQFEQLRRQVVPLAEARGYLTDEDVAADVS
jgi:predicted transcriptional regulator